MHSSETEARFPVVASPVMVLATSNGKALIRRLPNNKIMLVPLDKLDRISAPLNQIAS